MPKQLIDNIRNMRNDELIGLAKNRFIPEGLQLALVDATYRTAHRYLIENSGLTARARDLLWSDRVNSGYTYKSSLIAYGHYRDDIDKYWELFDRYPSAWYRSSWRMMNTFLYARFPSSEPVFWWKEKGLHCGANQTPPELLNKIYDTYFSRKIANDYRGANGFYDYGSRHRQMSFVRHPNCDLELAIKVSTCGEPEAERLGFQKIVELS
tara:strand:- start:441 stop:1070 length:630 start_codon:yes stop_codon:yes gene_type:complete